MTRTSKRNTIIAVCAGTLVLSTAALANYSTTNGYDALKQSLLATKDYTNCTVTGDMTADIDGQQFQKVSAVARLDSENKLYETINSYYDERGYHRLEDEEHSYHWTDGDFEASFYMYDTGYFRNNLWGIDEEDDKTASKVIKFAEVFADTVIGDIKNNFVCTDETDEYTSYTVSVDAVQMPPLVTAGMELIGSSISSDLSYYDQDNIEERERDFYELMSDVSIKNVTLDFNINKDGSPRDGKLAMSFTGGGHTLTANVNLAFSDIGTTVIEKPDGLDEAIEKYQKENPKVDSVYYED